MPTTRCATQPLVLAAAIALLAAMAESFSLPSRVGPPIAARGHRTPRTIGSSGCATARQKTSSARGLFEEYMSEDYDPTSANDDNDARDDDAAETRYGLGGTDLARRWTELVAAGHVSAVTEVRDGEDEENEGGRLLVRYGMRLVDEGPAGSGRLAEFVDALPPTCDVDLKAARRHVRVINETLAEMQSSGEEAAIECLYDGPYAVQLQLVRTLRPPRSRAMAGEERERTEGWCR